MKRTSLALALIATAAGSAAAVSTPAAAQDWNHRYYGADCGTHGSRTTGTVIGAALGALVGSQAAAPGSRGTGTLIGALAGGALGNVVGKGASSCERYSSRYDYRPAYYGARYQGSDRYGYGRYDARYDHRPYGY